MEIIFNKLLWEGQRAFRFLTCEWKFSSLSSFPPETQGEPAFSHTSMHTWGTFSHKAKQPPPPRYSQVRQFKKKQKAMESGKCKDRASFGGSTVQCYIAWPRNIHRFCNDFSPIGNHFQFQTPDPISSQLSFWQRCFLSHPVLYGACWILCPAYLLHTCPGIWAPVAFSLPASCLDYWWGELGLWKALLFERVVRLQFLQTAACKHFNIYAPCTDTE